MPATPGGATLAEGGTSFFHLGRRIKSRMTLADYQHPA